MINIELHLFYKKDVKKVREKIIDLFYKRLNYFSHVSVEVVSKSDYSNPNSFLRVFTSPKFEECSDDIIKMLHYSLNVDIQHFPIVNFIKKKR